MGMARILLRRLLRRRRRERYEQRMSTCMDDALTAVSRCIFHKIWGSVMYWYKASALYCQVLHMLFCCQQNIE
jgi:hypothetical protein